MQLHKAQSLREQWGDKPCEHPNFEKEYYLGAQTMDYICTTCGQSFDRNEVQKITNQREINKK